MQYKSAFYFATIPKSKFGFGAKKIAAEHAQELAAYDAAYATLMRLNNKSIKVDTDALEEEKKKLTARNAKLTQQLEHMKPQLDPLRKIRKCIHIVEADLDHAERRPSLREELKQIAANQKRSDLQKKQIDDRAVI